MLLARIQNILELVATKTILLLVQVVRLRCLQYLLYFGNANLPDVHSVGITDANLAPFMQTLEASLAFCNSDKAVFSETSFCLFS